MKLVHPDYTFQIEFIEGMATELIIENTNIFSDFLFELINQIQGEEGRFVLSHENNIIKLSQNIECIINPFDLDINKKKIINKLYELIKQEINYSELIVELGDIYTKFIELMNKIKYQVDYELDFKEEIDINAFLKYMDVKIENNCETLLEKIIDYTKILYKLLKQDIIILVNIKSYLSEKELEHLLKYSAYEKIHFLFIESIDRGIIKNNIRKIIIDKDRCEIFK